MDDTTNLSWKDGIPQHIPDGEEATHNRSVAGSSFRQGR